jgi:transposase
MRGRPERQARMLFGETPDDLIPASHPIRRIRLIVERCLSRLDEDLTVLYAVKGRPSVPPEHLLKATILMALFTVRSDRQFCERLQYDLLFKWFLDLNITDAAFDHSTFTKNRKRLLQHGIARQLLHAVVDEAELLQLTSDQHFTVDGTLLTAWASHKSFKPKTPKDPPDPPSGEGSATATTSRNPSVDFRGERRTNETHCSTTDPDARLARKSLGQPATLSYLGHVLMENRNGLVVDATLTQARGTAEVEAALTLLADRPAGKHLTVGADKGYDTAWFVDECRRLQVTPHVAQKTKRSAVDGRTTRHPGYRASQKRRKRVEEIFGWVKTVGNLRKLPFCGTMKNEAAFLFRLVAYNLRRLATLTAPATT